MVISNTITMQVIDPSLFKIVNTFTPNNDGINDFWNIPGLSSFPNCLVSIYNRYGTRLYEKKGYSTPWDGTYNGQPLPASTYYYIIDLGFKNIRFSGPVTIVR